MTPWLDGCRSEAGTTIKEDLSKGYIWVSKVLSSRKLALSTDKLCVVKFYRQQKSAGVSPRYVVNQKQLSTSSSGKSMHIGDIYAACYLNAASKQ